MTMSTLQERLETKGILDAARYIEQQQIVPVPDDEPETTAFINSNHDPILNRGTDHELDMSELPDFVFSQKDDHSADAYQYVAGSVALNTSMLVPNLADANWTASISAAEVQSTSEGRKDDSGKIQMELIPPELMEAVGTVLTFGAQKYAPRNWEKGMNWSRVFGALMRHMWAWWKGEKSDPETGYSHLWHAGCCICFLIVYEARGSGTDDRFKG